MADVHNVFISHYSGDVQRLRDLKQRLKAVGCDARNSSVEEDKDNKIVRRGRIVSDKVIARYLRMGIKWAKTFIVIIGEHTHERAWVNYEIKKAHDLGKQIVGIYDYGCKDKVDLPEAFKRYGNATIGWNSIDKLSDIISGKQILPEAPNGEDSAPIYHIVHIKC